MRQFVRLLGGSDPGYEFNYYAHINQCQEDAHPILYMSFLAVFRDERNSDVSSYLYIFRRRNRTRLGKANKE